MHLKATCLAAEVKLPRISGFQAVKALGRIGYALDHQAGSHIIMYHPFRKRLSIPNHRELDTGMLRSIIKDAGLSVEEFVELL